MWAGLLCPSRAFGHHCKRPTTDLPRLQYASLLQLSICARLQPKHINHRTQFILF